jgi:hypothetical protein
MSAFLRFVILLFVRNSRILWQSSCNMGKFTVLDLNPVLSSGSGDIHRRRL